MSYISREGTYSVKHEEKINKFGTNDVNPLWVADMDLPSPSFIVEALKKRAEHPIYGYTIFPDIYYQSIINWMQKQHSWSIKKECIVPIPGIVPALNLAIEALTNQNDAVLIQTPIYPPFFQAVKKQVRKLLSNTLIYENKRYEIDFKDFERKAKDTKLFLFCSPHNPTGRVWRQEELQRIVNICEKHDVLIVSDEVHADLVYEGYKHIPIAALSKNVITLNAPSKTFNIAGLSSAYAIIENDTIKRKFETIFKRYSLVSANPFSVEATIAAYQNGAEQVVDLMKYLSKNVEFLENIFHNNMPKIKPVEPESTFLLWLDCKELGFDDEELNAWFIEDAKVGLNSGISFGKGGEGFMRLNFALPQSELEKAMKQIEDAYINLY